MPKPKFNPEHLSIVHPQSAFESFPLTGGAAFEFFSHSGSERLAVELATDWIDLEDSELIGESETLACVWGIPITKTQAEEGISKSIQLMVSDEVSDGSVAASFFASVGHRVDRVDVEFPGNNRIRLALYIDDITEETDECNTVITFDTTLETKANLDFPG